MVSSNPSKNRVGPGCLMLFALPFAAFGLFMALRQMTDLADYWRMRSWEEVPCRILKAELESHRSDDATTYEATAQYSYVYHGRQYMGTRVGIRPGSDNIGSFHQNAYRELERFERSGRPFRCYVNPAHAAESVLYRNLRWEMVAFNALFALGSGGVGIGVLICAVRGSRKGRAMREAMAAHPEEPWLALPEWAEGRITSSNKRMMVLATCVAIGWLAGSSLLLVLLWHELAAKEYLRILLPALFAVIALGLAAWALVTIFRWLKYGESVFEMASLPGVIGGSLAGVVHVPRRVQAEEYRLTLLCVRRVTTHTGSESRTTETVAWQDQRRIQRELGQADPGKSAVPVLFAIPYDQPPSTVEPGDSQVIWKLEATASVPGVDYRAVFIVPVFKTEASREDFVLDESPIAAYAARRDPENDLRASGVIREMAPDGLADRYVFPLGRNLLPSLGFAIFWLIWTGAVVVMVKLGAPWFFWVWFALFDLLFTWIAFDLLLSRSVVDISSSGVVVRSGILVLGNARRLGRDEIERFEAKSYAQFGRTALYQIQVVSGDKRRTTAGKNVAGRRAAEAVAAAMEKSLGRQSTDSLRNHQ